MSRFITFLSVLTLALAACSPADWAAVNAAGSTVGAAVDTFALVRAEQIRAKSKAAEDAAAKGDTFTAMRELNAALAAMAAWEELQEVRARCPAGPAPPPTAPPSSLPSAPGAP